MDAPRRPRVKVCCIGNPEEAALAVSFGASALGLVSWMPSGPGVISDVRIAEIAATVPPGVDRFLLTCAPNAQTIAAQVRHTGCGTVQLVDALPEGTHAELRSLVPGLRIVQVIHVTGPDAVEEALAIAPEVDALLLDSGNPALLVKELGGTGRRHDWTLSRRIREGSPVPVYLAGGLGPHNVREAMEAVGPFGLDVCSGLRKEGCLDPAKLQAFMAEVERA